MFRSLFQVPLLFVAVFAISLGTASSSLGNVSRTEFIRADANQDSRVNISDAIVALQFTFNGGTTLCPDAMDVDGNRVIDGTDGVFVISYLFLQGPPPPPPFPACGPDTEEGALGCEVHAACTPEAS